MIKKFLCMLMILCTLPSNISFAHPGNTDSSGGHTCRTNCDDWGLNYGEYHSHNSYSVPSVSRYEDGYNKGYDLAYSYTSKCETDYDWWWNGSREFGDGYEGGIYDGHSDGLKVCFEDSYQIGYDTGYDGYFDGSEYSEETNQAGVDETSYGKGYAEGYEKAKSDKSERKFLAEYVLNTVIFLMVIVILVAWLGWFKRNGKSEHSLDETKPGVNDLPDDLNEINQYLEKNFHTQLKAICKTEDEFTYIVLTDDLEIIEVELGGFKVKSTILARSTDEFEWDYNITSITT